jgi:hypothetical protein
MNLLQLIFDEKLFCAAPNGAKYLGSNIYLLMFRPAGAYY